MEKTKPISNGAVRDIPMASPYYDRLRSLNIELDFVPFGSPEWHYLTREVEEMERRALQHMDLARRVEILM